MVIKLTTLTTWMDAIVSVITLYHIEGNFGAVGGGGGGGGTLANCYKF